MINTDEYETGLNIACSSNIQIYTYQCQQLTKNYFMSERLNISAMFDNALRSRASTSDVFMSMIYIQPPKFGTFFFSALLFSEISLINSVSCT